MTTVGGVVSWTTTIEAEPVFPDTSVTQTRTVLLPRESAAPPMFLLSVDPGVPVDPLSTMVPVVQSVPPILIS
jgi:hypothetical protein